jgi:hypothetical protein
MTYSRDYLEERRRKRVKRRRAIAASAAFVVLCAVGAGVFLLNRQTQIHHVVVVRVANVPATPHASPAQHEYPAAPGAPDLKTVKANLAATKSEHHTSDQSGGSGSILTSDAASSLPAGVGVAVAALGSGATETLGSEEAAHGWSTTKVPVLVSLLRVRGSEGLTAQEKVWAHAAITESDNQSVLDLFGDLERLKGGLIGASEYMDSVLRRGGDTETSVATAPPPAGAVTTFGQTEWSPLEAAKFFRALALGCLLPSESQTNEVLGLMESIVSSESWGLGSAGFSSVAFKGGWGPEGGGYLVRQSGIIEPGSPNGVAVAIVTSAPSFAAGTETLTRTASWLAKHLGRQSHASSGACPTAE